MMMKDTMFLFLLAFIFIIIVLYITFRRFTDVLLTLAVIVVTIIWVEGLSGWLGFPFTYASSAIMPLLLGIDIAYAIHVMSRYYEERRKGNDPYVSTVTSVVTVGVAVFLTAATTAFGFVSFGISSMPPIIQFGMLCVAGVMISFVLAITLLPATIVLRDRSPRAQERWARRQAKKADRMGDTWLDKSLAKLSVLSEHHRVIVGIVTVCIIAACIILSFRITTEADMNSMTPKDTPSAIAQTEITHFFGGQDIGIALAGGDILQAREPPVHAGVRGPHLFHRGAQLQRQSLDRASQGHEHRRHRPRRQPGNYPAHPGTGAAVADGHVLERRRWWLEPYAWSIRMATWP